jgi:glycosyltransferase involved in cell wall biosynthesis
MMKVALYGNVCNNYYVIAKCLRENNIADAHLYLNDKVDMQHRPESDDPHLKDNYPEWIHMDSRWDPFKFLKRFDKSFIKELNTYDLVFLSDLGVLLAPYLKPKRIFYVTGGDLTRLPFSDRYMQEFSGLKFWVSRPYISFMQRKGIRHFDKIITQPFYPFRSALEKIKVDNEKVSKSYYPVLIDTSSIKFAPNAWENIDAGNRTTLKAFNFIFFHPSRLFIEKKKNYVEMGVWKGNDNLFKGFGIFLKKYKIDDACIAMPERIHSPDINLAKQIITGLGIEKNIVWLKPSTEEGFTRRELINYYSLSDLVADEFGTGWFGAIVLEGMACGKPTFCYVDETVMKQLYPWHPIISVKDPEQIAERIAEFYFDRDKRLQHGELSRKWVDQFHSLKNGKQMYIENFKKDIQDIFKLNGSLSG